MAAGADWGRQISPVNALSNYSRVEDIYELIFSPLPSVHVFVVAAISLACSTVRAIGLWRKERALVLRDIVHSSHVYVLNTLSPTIFDYGNRQV